MVAYTTVATVAVKTAVLVQRINNITFEEFDNYWSHEHPKAILQVPTFVEKALNYTQVFLSAFRSFDF